MENNYEKSAYLYGKGAGSFKRGEFDEALNYYQQSLKLDNHSRTYARIYECLLSLGKDEEARPYIEIAYNMNKNHDKVAIQ
ncbi:tetratricopeptide repeat protein [Paenalkalicoccus suaedae]|uniref:Tetratricopeptide repeat protein n=1 Tax=Paenalkalicoccus suaedae TaxID=2592382 RepID=A0A859FHQ0_9BACI|nr:tetratricopeptide repeat protein [Paenalkalicoccus suaedae]QKS72330.1 tetratricopeptide repeat protein [Paenalkalicoccus suaedae]